MRNLNKEKLLKYGEYLKEKLDPWKLKQSINSFNRLSNDAISIPGDLKDLSQYINNEILNSNLPYNKLISFGGIDINLKIIKTNRYYSNVDWIKFLSGEYEIVIEVIQNYDIHYVVSTVIHEIRHMIDFTDENINSGLSSFDIDKNLRKYNINNFETFFKLVYISLEHELVARNNQVYPYIKFKNITKEESMDILKQSFIWKSINMLNEFNYKSFIDRFDKSDLIQITNSFIKDCLYDNITTIDDQEELCKFYEIWNDYFKEVHIKWKSILLSEVDLIYERKVLDIDNPKNYKEVIIEIWKKIK